VSAFVLALIMLAQEARLRNLSSPPSALVPAFRQAFGLAGIIYGCYARFCARREVVREKDILFSDNSRPGHSRRGGPTIRYPGAVNLWGNLQTDMRRTVRFTLMGSGFRWDFGALFAVHPRNVFLVKFSYGFQL